MFSHTRASTLVALTLSLASAACSGGNPTQPGGGTGTLLVSANVSGTSVATVVAQVTAPDITTPLVFNIPITNGVATGTITLSAGTHRTITMHAFDTGGVETHTGAVTIDVQAGTNPTISMILTPLNGTVPINVTLGSLQVTVTPSANTISLAGTAPTAQLTATVKDQNGNPVTGAVVTWATAAPGVASVSASGLVTALHVGQTNLFATYQGAVGSATVTVTP